MNPHTVLRTEEIEHIGAEARHLVTHACLAFMSASYYRLQPAAREIRTQFVAEQRNSVNYRFDSLAFHLHLIEFVLATHDRGPGRRHRRNGRRWGRRVARGHEQQNERAPTQHDRSTRRSVKRGAYSDKADSAKISRGWTEARMACVG